MQRKSASPLTAMLARQKEDRKVAREEYATIYPVIRAIIALRILLFASVVTGLGVLMNTYRPPAPVPAIMRSGTEAFIGTVAAARPHVVIIWLSVLIVTMLAGVVFAFDFTLAKIQRDYLQMALSIETILRGRLRFYGVIVQNELAIKTAFIVARAIVSCVALLWVISYVLGI